MRTGTDLARSTPRRLLVVPGIGGSPDLLLSAGDRLFHGLRTVAFDHTADLADGGLNGLADRAMAALDGVGPSSDPVFVCGESFGGTVALTIARRYPERVRGLILLSAFGRYPGIVGRGSTLGFAVWRLIGDDIAARVVYATRPLGVPGALGLRFSRQVLSAYLRERIGEPKGYRTKCQLAVQFDARPWLRTIRCPTLVMVGAWDPIVPTSAGVELARSIPNARLYRQPGGHVGHVVHAERVGQWIAAWMAEIESATQPKGRPWPSFGLRGDARS